MGLLSFRKKKKDAGTQVEPEFKPRHDDAPAPSRSRAKERKNSSSEPVDPVLPEKKRARRRLLGAVALVVAVVIGLPMVLDSEPKPLADDIAIKIPSKDKPGAAADTPAPGASSAASIAATLDPKEDIVSGPAPAAVATAATAAVATAALAAKSNAAAPTAATTPAPQEPKQPEPKPDAAPPSKPAAVAPQNPVKEAHKAEVKKPEPKKPEVKKPEPKKPEPKKAEVKPEPKKAEAKPEPKKAEVKPAPAKPVVEARPEPKAEAVTIQVAALASTEKVNEVLAKLRSAGIASYSQKVNTDAGERTRIRVTVSSKAEAEKMKAKLASIGLGGAAVVPSH